MITAEEARNLANFATIAEDIAYKKEYPAKLEEAYKKIVFEAKNGYSFACVEVPSRRLAADIKKDLELSGFSVSVDFIGFSMYLGVNWYA